jgi:hypothetical protein
MQNRTQHPPPPSSAGSFGPILDAAAVALVWLILTFPSRYAELSSLGWACLPLEAGVLGLVLWPGGGLGAWTCRIASLALAAAGLLKVADIVTDQAFGRPFNPLLDYRFPLDGAHLLKGSLGWIGALALLTGVLALAAGLVTLIHAALGRLQFRLHRSPKGGLATLLALSLLWSVLAAAGLPGAGRPLVQWLAGHGQSLRQSLSDLASFEALVDHDPYAATPGQALFGKLKGKDVVLVFVESYGRTVLDRADYAAWIEPLLERGDAALHDHGYQACSAYLRSPTYGGISWLAHATLLSGLWIDSQVRYDRLVMSRRATLNRLFHRAGWRTVTVQPANTMDWPQGAYYGYDRIYAA